MELAYFALRGHYKGNPWAFRLSLIFAWYDLWIGAFWDRKSRKLYLLPFPCVGLVVAFAEN